ncbi:MAG: AbrB/MazE/SpoVT family DNA-binding domain-containing protein [Candidatus Omnitrophota bacterium]
MRTRVQKWGNSLAMRIPMAFAANMHIQNNSTVEITFWKGKMLVNPVKQGKWTLEKLLDEVNRDNIHDGVDTGKRTGKEVW